VTDPLPNKLSSMALASLGSVALIYTVQHTPGLVHAPAAINICVGMYGLLSLAWLSPSTRVRLWLRAALAIIRAATLFALCAQWATEAREVIGALCVAVIWRDMRTGECAARPLLPLALGLTWALAWTVVRPSDAVPRVAAVAAIAALGLRESWWTTDSEAASRS
jgi:hypothetical protein